MKSTLSDNKNIKTVIKRKGLKPRGFHYDAIVVGAGPAGSTVAKEMAQAGMKVLLVDRKSEIGHIKRCGEGLSKRHLEIAGIKPDPVWIRQKIDGSFVFSPNGTKIELKNKETEGFVIERKVFDKWLAIKATEVGAHVKAGMNCIDIIKENEKIMGVVLEGLEGKEKVFADIIIAADGVDSVLARKAGINTTIGLNDICSSAEFEMSGIKIEDNKKIEIYFGNEIAPGGYAWVFPKGNNTANVGLGIRASKPGVAYDYLKRFVKQKGYDAASILEINIGGVPVGGNIETHVLDNFAIVGDAARQVNPVHGGGIGLSIRSAKILSEVVVKAWKKQDYSAAVLKEYEKKWDEEFGEKMRKLLKVRKFYEKLNDDELNDIAGMVSGFDLLELSQGKLTSFLKILKQKPKLLKYAWGLFRA